MSNLAILFAHGAGLGTAAPWMQAWAKRLAALGAVTMFDYPYMAAGKKRPDPPSVLVARHREQVQALRARHSGPVVLAGKSMGSRIGCHVALEERVDALACFGYPLVGASAKAPVRDQVLLQLKTPILFLQGTKDALCPLEKLEEVRKKMSARSVLHVVEGGDHSLRVGKRDLAARGGTQAGVDDDVQAAIRSFLTSIG